MIVSDRPQLEGLDAVHAMNMRTDYYGFVETPFGRMFLGGSDDGIVGRYHNGYIYEPVSLALWQHVTANKDIVVDVGAHTGVYSLAAAKAGAQHVIAVEPFYLNAARLHLNLNANQMRAEVAHMAASDLNGFMTLNVHISCIHNGYCTAAGSLSVKPAAYIELPVRTVRLDTMVPAVHHARVGAMKFDVEYHLAQALAGAPQILAHQPDLIFEVFEERIADLLPGYLFWHIDEHNGLRPVASISKTTAESSRNYFASVRPAPEEFLA